MKLSLENLKGYVETLIKADKISNNTFTATRNNTVGLLDKIAKTVTIETDFSDRLEELGGDRLEYGQTIEEWAQDLIMPEAFDREGSGALKPETASYRPVYYSYAIPRQKIKTTLRNGDVEKAVKNHEEFAKILARKAKRLTDSELALRYEIKRERLGTFYKLCKDVETTATTFNKASTYDNGAYVKNASEIGVIVKEYKANDATDWVDAIKKGYIVKLDLITTLAVPNDKATGEKFLKQLKKDIEVASDISEGHSLNGGTLGASNHLKLFVKQGVIPSLEVDTLAGVYQLEKRALPIEVKVVKDFGGAPADRYAVLRDTRAVKLYPNYRAVREQENADGDFTNLILHVGFTPALSRNAFVKWYKA